MYRFINIFIALFISIPVLATGQIPDRLIYQGDALLLFANPLQQLEGFDTSMENLFREKAQDASFSTACWRGYVAQWMLIDNQLFLDNIYSCDNDDIAADLNKLFGSRCINGRVKADWVNGEIISPQGKCLYYVHDGYESFYEREIGFTFRNGILMDTKHYDNSKTKMSEYGKDMKKLRDFIYQNIRWDSIPLKDDAIVRVIFSANENGVIDQVKVVRGADDVYNKEAVRVIKSIPEWDVYFKHGRLVRKLFGFSISFSQEEKRKAGK